jgi:hypothetical protein
MMISMLIQQKELGNTIYPLGLVGVPVLPVLFWRQLKLEKTWIY